MVYRLNKIDRSSLNVINFFVLENFTKIWEIPDLKNKKSRISFLVIQIFAYLKN